MCRQRGGNVETTFAEAAHAVGVFLQVSRALGAQIECRVIIGVRRHLRREVRMKELPASEARRIERFWGERNRAAQILGEARELDDVPVGLREDTIVAGDDEDIGVRGEKDLVRWKVLIERR